MMTRSAPSATIASVDPDRSRPSRLPPERKASFSWVKTKPTTMIAPHSPITLGGISLRRV
jgi:hypothetical protein